MTNTLVKQSAAAPVVVAKACQAFVDMDDDDLIDLSRQLRSLQAERLMIKCARDNLESVAALSLTNEVEFQNRFDKITDATIDLAETAARLRAKSLAQLSAKAAFVLELAEPSQDNALEKLIWGLAVDIIAFSSEHALD